ncbi:hypothetical protein [Hymenobacter rubidus]|uniref:hypothetical protein n=1 Tax=Hymenobacter rubidus TaxID=1441626 RepID=UPI00191D1EC3|nr:hypothetical protein [Hymenobacter rubidus]
MFKLFLVLACICLLASCSAPVQPPFTYPEDKSLSSPQGIPPDSATSYFPAGASINTSNDTLIRRLGDCQDRFRRFSEYLFGFGAPVLSNYYLGHSIYRFLWIPARRYPVLITVDLTETGGVLTTQLLNRAPEPIASAAKIEAESKPLIQRITELNKQMQAGEHVADNTERVASAKDQLDYIKLTGKALIIKNETAVVLSRIQIQQFQKLLTQVGFWQLPGCEPSCCFDGATYVLEAHEPNRYQVVQRECFIEKSSGFLQCCQFLLNLSPAKPKPSLH